ncbi:DUF192 domain-containing protein [Aerophototrophica crusticola]|uniref:DUF192 domain-containing protein n=1 Tax=Aerophototrophica crusticola TaxID=1709002 RepID=A0A858R6V5_9PROT|nr:DUF192 domain-containing protein [Rhodospirillaceae bacterium B3]
MRLILRLIAPALILFGLLAHPALSETLATDSLVIETAGGAKHRFTVELAITPAQQARGLMYRERMDDDKGMLFPYDRPQPLSFWMKNTLIPLDIIYIAEGGRILNIANAKPLDLTPLYSEGPAIAALEVNGGLAARLGIRLGDMVRHPAVGTKRAP